MGSAPGCDIEDIILLYVRRLIRSRQQPGFICQPHMRAGPIRGGVDADADESQVFA